MEIFSFSFRIARILTLEVHWGRIGKDGDWSAFGEADWVDCHGNWKENSDFLARGTVDLCFIFQASTTSEALSQEASPLPKDRGGGDGTVFWFQTFYKAPLPLYATAIYESKMQACPWFDWINQFRV